MSEYHDVYIYGEPNDKTVRVRVEAVTHNLPPSDPWALQGPVLTDYLVMLEQYSAHPERDWVTIAKAKVCTRPGITGTEVLDIVIPGVNGLGPHGDSK
jgi:hypothetical protein